jgi:hypothetical protein
MQGQVYASSTPLFRDALALLIGISTYRRQEQITRELGTIYRAHSDAMSLKQTLRKIGYHDSNLRSLCDHDATMQAIWRELIALRQLEPRARLVLIFWAGHGVLDQGRNYLLPWDTNLSDLSRTALLVDELAEAIFWINAAHIALFLDTCYSKPSADFARSFDQVELGQFRGRLPGKGRAFVGASTELAIESDEGGILAICLDDGLRGRLTSDETGVVYLGRLITYLQSAISREATKAWKRGKPSCNNPQNPYVSFSYEGPVSGDPIVGLHFPKYLVRRVTASAEIPESVKELALKVIHKSWPGDYIW